MVTLNYIVNPVNGQQVQSVSPKYPGYVSATAYAGIQNAIKAKQLTTAPTNALEAALAAQLKAAQDKAAADAAQKAKSDAYYAQQQAIKDAAIKQQADQAAAAAEYNRQQQAAAIAKQQADQAAAEQQAALVRQQAEQLAQQQATALAKQQAEQQAAAAAYQAQQKAAQEAVAKQQAEQAAAAAEYNRQQQAAAVAKQQADQAAAEQQAALVRQQAQQQAEQQAAAYAKQQAEQQAIYDAQQAKIKAEQAANAQQQADQATAAKAYNDKLNAAYKAAHPAVTAEQQAKNNYGYLLNTYNPTSGAPLPVESSKNLPKITSDSVPIQTADNNLVYYPTANGWQQKTDPSAANYSKTVTMNTPALGSSSTPFKGPDGQMYYPIQSIPGKTGNTGWYNSQQVPNITTVYQNNINAVRTSVDPSAYQPVPADVARIANYESGGASKYKSINGQLMYQTVNPYAPGYLPNPDQQFNYQRETGKTAFGRQGLVEADTGTIMDFVKAVLPLAAKALLAYGIGNLDLLELADAGELTVGDLLDSGIDTDIINDIVATTPPVEIPSFDIPDFEIGGGPVMPEIPFEDIGFEQLPTPTMPEYPEFGTMPFEPEIPSDMLPGFEQPALPVEPTIPVEYGPDLPTPEMPYDVPSTGISDMEPGTVFDGPNGKEIVLDSGKTVNLEDYQNAANSGQPVSVDGNMTTGGRVTVELGQSPVEPPGGWNPLPTPEVPIEAPISPEIPGVDVPSVGELPEVIVTASRELGLSTEQIMALGGVAAATAAVAAMGSSGAAAAANAAIANPTPVSPPGPTPSPTPVEPTPTPPSPAPVGPEVPPSPAPVGPEVPPGPAPVGPEVPPGPVTPEPPITQPPVGPEPITPAPVEPTPVVPEPPVTPPTEAPVYDYSTPYEGPYSDESVLSRYLGGTLTYGDILKGIAIGMIAPSVLGMLGFGGPQAPQKKGYGPLAPIQWGTLEGGLTNPGMNPGYLTSQTPFYQTTDPVQSQYYWGQHPYIKTLADIDQWRNVPEAPAVPFGIQQQRGAFDTQKFIRETIGTPQYQQAATGSSAQYPATYAPATSYTGSPVAPVTTPQATPAVQTQQMNTTYTPRNLQQNIPTAPAVPQINMTFAPVAVPTTLPAWAPGQWDLTQPVTPYGTTPAPVKA